MTVVCVISLLCLGCAVHEWRLNAKVCLRDRMHIPDFVKYLISWYDTLYSLHVLSTVLKCCHGWLDNGLRTRVTPCGLVPSLPSRQDGIFSILPPPFPTPSHSVYSIAEASTLSALITLLSLIIIKIDFLKSHRPLSDPNSDM